MVTTDFKKTIKAIVTQLVSVLNTRNRDVVSRRFGLKTGEKQTLESIGKTYGITRERVRQIEESSLKTIREAVRSGFSQKLKPFATLALTIVDEAGGVIREDELFVKFFGNAKNGSANASLSLVLALDGTLKKHAEDDNLNTFWSSNEQKQSQFIQLVNTCIKALNKVGSPIDEAEVADLYADAPMYVKEPASKVLSLLLCISKSIDRNVFGQIGLSDWPEVRPRGVRDKSFLVLKRAAKPQHFRDITQLINQQGFSKHRANVQTVHNELIKDKRFVLVGRGMYGLSEWGYQRGTIKELIVELLKQKGAMPKDKIVAHLMGVRFVKQNTIVLGLQDKSLFKHDDRGHVTLRNS